MIYKIGHCYSFSFGYNAREDKYEDLIKAGIIDPTKVTRIAIENAASIASMLLTTECVIADSPEDDAMPMGGGGMPGIIVSIMIKNMERNLKVILYEKSHPYNSKKIV